MTNQVKRQGGGLKSNGVFLVFGESVLSESGTYTHHCGSVLGSASVTLSHRNMFFLISGNGETRVINVPFCPNCEKMPTEGVYYDRGSWHITRWDDDSEEREVSLDVEADVADPNDD